jgi:hypothetical protein
MKKYIITLAISSAVVMGNAQTNQGGWQKPDPQAQTDKMAENFGLSADQKTKVLAVNTDAAQKMQALSANNNDRESMRGERKKIEQEKESKLKEILTDEQFKKYMAKKEEMKQQRQQRQGQN